jgi:competence protein ComEA
VLPRPRRRLDVEVVRARLLALANGSDAGPAPHPPDEELEAAPSVTLVRPGPLRPVVVTLVAAAITAWVVVRVVAGPAPGPVELVPGTPVPLASAGAAAGPSLAPSPSGSAVTELVVHVLGDVRRPGLVHLPAGARVADAIAAAGGLTSRGSSGALNLARAVVDGEQIVVSPDAQPAPAAEAPAPGSPGAVVDLNTATAAELDTLPGVGPVMSARILEWRTAHGRFASVEQLREISGIGERTFERLAPLVRV